MGMETSAITILDEPFSESETAGNDFRDSSQKKEIVTQYLSGAFELAHPRHNDRMYRFLEIARIVQYDFGLAWNDAYDIMAAFNQSHVRPPIDDDSFKSIMNFVKDHFAFVDKPLGWRLDLETLHFEGEYDLIYHAFALNTNSPGIAAKAFLRSRCSIHGMIGMRFFQDKYWEWNEARYIKIDESNVRYRLEQFLEMAVIYSDEYHFPFPTTPKTLDAVMDSVQRNVFLPSDARTPYFLGCSKSWEASDTLILGSTKTLRLRDREVFDSQPCWFSTNNLDFDPDTYAPEPEEWNKFLNSVFENDQESIDMLHEFMGLLVSGITDYQMMLLLIGVPRSGKGTVVRIMEKLVGLGNFCALTVDQLTDKFGLGNLPGKKLIELNEAYFTNKPSDKRAITRILSMIGLDDVVIERKYKNSFSARIDGRLVMTTNNLPNLTNVGSALSARLLPIVFKKSFAGSEDVNLAAKLEAELPSILNLALAGLERLQARGRFILPLPSEEMLTRIRRRFDPINEFINEQCNRRGKCPVKRLLDAYNQWRKSQDMEPITSQMLGTELANDPGITIHQTTGGSRFYEGVELK